MSKQKNEFVQDFIPVKNIRHGIIETNDGRYIKILEIEPINFMLRSEEEQLGIISSFANWLKISPMRLQFKSVTRKADSEKHIALLREELKRENNPRCKELAEGYIGLIRDVGSREALTRRFFLIFQYEDFQRSEDFGKIYGMLQTAEQNARAYFSQCGNAIIQPSDPDEANAEILYMYFNRRSCTDEPFADRVQRIVLDRMKMDGKTLGVDPIPDIPILDFISPRGIDLTKSTYVIIDGLYYSFLYVKADGYPGSVRAGWMSMLINAGEGIDVDVHLRRESRSKTIDKVAQRIRLNRTKIKGIQDTSTDYEELTNSIQAGYYIKNGLANNNEDLFYMSVFITVSAKTLDEMLWRKQQIVDMMKSMDMQLSDCRFQQEAALRSVMPFLYIEPHLEKKSKRNVLTSGAASTYIFTSFEGKLLPVGMVIALDYIWDKIKSDITEKKAVIIDEIWQLVGASSNKMAAEFCLTIFKTIRGFGGAAVAATQDLSDFFGLDDGRYGRAIINNSQNKIVLNLEYDEAEYVREVLKLSKTELRSITRFERGEALVCSGNNKVPVMVKASKSEQEMITTDRAELQKILAERRKKNEE